MLIPREAIENKVEKHLREIAEASTSKSESKQWPKIIFNLHGITGIGKSCVVQRLLEQHKGKTPTLWIDFNPEPGISAAEGPQHQTLADLLETLRTIPVFAQLNPNATDADNKSVETVRHKVAYSVNLTGQSVRLVLLDGLDGLIYWRWIQRNIIKPLAEEQKSLVIVTSQPPLFWHFWELRESADEIEVQPFSRTEAQDYLKHLQSSWACFAPLLHTYTRGYPFGLKLLPQILDANHPAVDDSTELPCMNDIEKSFSPETFQIVRFIGFLRKPTIPDMHVIMQHVQPDNPTWTQRASARDRLIRATFKMRQERFLEPSTLEQPGIHFNEQFRLAIESHLRTTDPDLYLSLCEKLCIHYEEQVDTDPNQYRDLFAEWLYFSVPLVKAGRIPGEVWARSYHRLVGRVKLVSNIHSLLTHDNSLLAQLRQLPDHEQAVLGELIVKPTVSKQYTDEVLGRIEQAFSTEPPVISDYQFLLQHIPKTTESFDIHEWRRSLKDTGMKVGQMNNIIPILHSRSLIIFDRPERKYRLNTILQPIVEQLCREKGAHHIGSVDATHQT